MQLSTVRTPTRQMVVECRGGNRHPTLLSAPLLPKSNPRHREGCATAAITATFLRQVTFGHKLVPDRKRVQQRVGKSRVWRYVLPPLAECRAAFETWIGAQIDWTGDDDYFDILELL